MDSELKDLLRGLIGALDDHSAALREHAEALRLEAGGDEAEEITL